MDNKKFIRFTNGDGKSWIVPIRNMRTALNIYQPSGIRGKLVKGFLPYLHWLSPIRKIIKAESRQIELDDELKRLLCGILSLDDFDFSIFGGTPSVHQKSTIQISQGDKILAYCKVTKSEEVAKLFRGEQQMLESLHRNGVTNIPKPLYCGEISENTNTTIFVQSTIKTNCSKTLHCWRSEHQQFIEMLYDRTKVTIPFAESDFAKSLTILESYANCLSVDYQQIIHSKTDEIREHFVEQDIEMSAYHGDFTPWNMFLEGGVLFVFDFEYAALKYPPYLDWFHFFTQSSYFERNLSVDKTIAEFRHCPIENSRTLYISYLLDIISRHIVRDGGLLTPQITFWIDILNRL